MQNLTTTIGNLLAFIKYEKPFFRMIAVILAALSCSLLLIVPDSAICSVSNVMISVALLFFPESYIPLILTSSVSQSVSIFGFSATYYYLFILFCYVAIRSRLRFNLTDGRSWISLLVFVLWLIACAASSLAGTMFVAIKVILMISLSFLCASTKVLGISNSLKFVMEISPIFLLIVLIKLLFAPVSYVIEGHYTLTTGITVAPEINPNQIAQLIAVLFFLSFAAFFNTRQKLVPVVSLVIAFAVLFLLKSRTSLYAALIVSFLYFVFAIKLKPLIKIGAVSVSVLFLAYKFLTFSADPMDAIAHGEDKDMNIASVVESGGSGRFFTWEEVFTNVIPKSPIMGIGPGIENYEALGMEYDADNLYVDLLAETGIVGLVLFFVFFINLARDIRKQQTAGSVIVRYMLLMILFFGIGETVFDSFFMWSLVFLSYICFFSNKKHFIYE